MLTSRSIDSDARPRVQLVPSGLLLGSLTLPLVAGSFHYFRAEPGTWRPCLRAMRELGFRLVDTPVPWNLHELGDGGFDFGMRDPRLDLTAFLRAAENEDLYVVVRLGPEIDAELTYHAIPGRVIWNEECQARTARGRPVLTLLPPLAFPAPSHASQAFRREVAAWYRQVARRLLPHAWPDGPVVLVGVSDGTGFGLRDGVYDQDYHADAIALYRTFLRGKYGNVVELGRAHGASYRSFDDVEPPSAFLAGTAADLVPHLDWAEFQEKLRAGTRDEYRRALGEGGALELPVFQSLPGGRRARRLSESTAGTAVDLVGQDFSPYRSAADLRDFVRGASELVSRSLAKATPAFASSLPWGFPPHVPAVSEAELEFCVLAALGLGVRAFSVESAVVRDRFIGGVLGASGERLAGAAFWERLLLGLERVGFHELSLSARVGIVVPQAHSRLLRLLDVFGSWALPGASANALSASASISESRLLDADGDPGVSGTDPALIETEHFLERLVTVLERQGLAYGFIPSDLSELAFGVERWTIVACSGILEPDLVRAVEIARKAGQPITFGPRRPRYGADMRLLAPELAGANAAARWRLPPTQVFGAAGADIDAVVTRARDLLQLPLVPCTTPGIKSLLHVDTDGVPRVLGLVNPGLDARVAGIEVRSTEISRDIVSGEVFRDIDGELRVPMPARRARLLELGTRRGFVPVPG